jgi:hypothetical protein
MMAAARSPAVCEPVKSQFFLLCKRLHNRKAWLFSDTPAGARASALIYSLIETAKANGREPYAWLRYALERLPQAEAVSDFDALLPWRIHDQDLAMNLAAS